MPVPVAYFLVGPTAVGKSAVAHWIACNHGYDILSADSMQVYEGMDIGTAKPSCEERREVKYYGLDLVPPTSVFNVAMFRRYALDALEKAARAGRRMIVAGGSGLYIKSLTDGLADNPGKDGADRARWQELHEDGGVEALQDALRRMSPSAFDGLRDKSNPRRLIRALETVSAGCVLSGKTWRSPTAGTAVPGLDMDRAELETKIEERVRSMYASGLIDEARRLEESPGMSLTARQAIGYAEALECLHGGITQDDAVAKTVIRTRQLAKRQRTWFRHQANVRWFKAGRNAVVRETGAAIHDYWSRHGATAVAVD